MKARIAIEGVPDRPGVSHRIFSAIADRNIAVDMIAQNVGSNGRASIGFTVPGNELKATLNVLKPLAAEMGATIEHDAAVSKVSIVGTGMRTNTGVAEKMFSALANENVNMRMITTADIKISVLVARADGVRALRAVHQAFGLRDARPGPAKRAVRRACNTSRIAGTSSRSSERDFAALTQQLGSMEDIVVSDVLLATDQGRITIFGLPNRPGNCLRVFEAVAKGGIIVDMIVQNLTGGKAELSFSVPQPDLARALEQELTARRGSRDRCGNPRRG